MSETVILCGDGPLIPTVAGYLSEMRKRITIVSDDESLKVEGCAFVKGDPTKLATLQSAEVGTADTILVLCIEDWDAAFIVMNSRKLNPDAIIVANVNRENRCCTSGGFFYGFR